jgi:hypothetical protein
MAAQIRILIHGMTGNPGGMESFIMNYQCQQVKTLGQQFDL